MSRFSRPSFSKKQHRIIFIFTEGTKTEPNYFLFICEDLRITNNVKIEGTGFNTLSLVKKVIDFKTKHEFENTDCLHDEYWVVFDKDDFDRLGGRNQFDDAINKAKAKGINVAYSNESFELWYFLHFVFCDTRLKRSDYCIKLTRELKKATKGKIIKYQKWSKDMGFLLKNKQTVAIRNAKTLLKAFKKEPLYLKKNPSTTVHCLIENLNDLSGEINKVN